MSNSKLVAGWPGKVATAIATLGPLGTRMSAPGTWGSAAGMLLYSLVFRWFNHTPWVNYLLIALALSAVAIVLCAVAELHMNRKDPGCVILDEFVAMPLVYVGMEGTMATAHYPFVWFFAGFALFRFFDIIKPLGIKKLQKLPGGLGVVADDLAAAVASCGVLHVIAWLVTLLK
ncbi:MAG: phosphatidylglycerophosphatase A [Puniceicoccales bacterium]|jgi:phosphatidylglycerophosphatase A|nr:phosphatidylglycerophosphatase A [Puniceicoccales bacterium]